MADQNNWDKPDPASNHNTEVFETLRANIKAALAWLPGSRANPGTGAVRRSTPSAGEVLLETSNDATGSAWSTLFDSRNKVNKAGDTMTGPLTATQTLVVSGAAATPRQIGFTTLGVARWNLYANTVAESGANAGSDLALGRYSDGGVLIDNAFTVARATGGITFNAPSSGVALSVTAFAGSSGITVSGASTNAILSLSNTTSGNAYTDYTASGVRQFLVGTHRSSDEFRIVSGSSFDSSVMFAINNAGSYKFQSVAATKFIPGATSFALSNNANTADNLLVADAGHVTTPRAAGCIAARGTSSQTSGTVLLWNSEDRDISSNYDTSTGVFTAPVAGWYLVTFNAAINNTSGSTQTPFLTISASSGLGMAISKAIPTGTLDYIGGSALLFLSASGTVSINTTIAFTANFVLATNTPNHFAVRLVG